jgi:hypothetical protein
MTLEAQANERWQEIQKYWRLEDYRWLYALVGFLAGVFLGPFLVGSDSVLGDLFPEAAGILFTIVVLNQLAEKRNKRELKEALIRQLGSQSNDFALEAKRQLEGLDWLDEALARKRFRHADWQGSVLVNMNLVDSDLRDVKLMRTLLMNTNMAGANLRDAKLTNADLTHASLTRTDLIGTIMTGADLTDVDVTDCRTDSRTILPDGTYWTPDKDMARFTDQNHPEFWRSDDPNSPAHWGAKG